MAQSVLRKTVYRYFDFALTIIISSLNTK